MDIPKYDSVPELREFAKEIGIKNTARKNEQQLAEAILEVDEESVERTEETVTEETMEGKEDAVETVEEETVEPAKKVTNADIEEMINAKNHELELHRKKELEIIEEIRQLSSQRTATEQKDFKDCVKEYHNTHSPAVQKAQEMAQVARIAMKRAERRMKMK